MFKKITKLALAAIASVFVTTACTDESTPTEIIQKANYIKHYKEFHKVMDHYSDDFVLRARNGVDYNQEKLRAISQRATLLPQDKVAARATIKTILMDTFEVTPEQLDAHYAKAPDTMLKMEELLIEISAGKAALAEKKANSFKILHEATKGETSTVIAEYKEFTYNSNKEIVESATVEVTFTLNEIDDEWKIVRAAETKK